MSLINSIAFIWRHPFNRDLRFRALMDFAKWQVGSRLVPGAIVVDWVNGTRFLVRKGETGLTGNIYAGLHEFPDMAYLLHVLRPEDTFVDVGANVGSYTLLACGAAGARGWAFEPISATFARLKENVRLNRLEGRVTCVNKGVGAREGSVDFSSGLDTMNHVVGADEKCERVERVDVTTLDAFLCDDAPSVIKIDVEGFEVPVLEGARSTLQAPTLHSVIVETNGSGETYGFAEGRIFELLGDAGFAPMEYEPFSRRLIEPAARRVRSGNTLFVRHRARVDNLLARAPTYSVLGRRI